MRLIVRKKIALILVFVTAFSGMMFVGTDASYAASRPAKVTGLKVSSKTTETINLQWSKAKRARKYQLAYRVAGGSWKYKTIKARSYKLTRLKSYTRYYFKVRGINKSRRGKWSSTKNVYTDPRNPGYDHLPLIANLRVTRVGPGSICVAWSADWGEPEEEEESEQEECAPESEKEPAQTDSGNENQTSPNSEPQEEAVIENPVKAEAAAPGETQADEVQAEEKGETTEALQKEQTGSEPGLEPASEPEPESAETTTKVESDEKTPMEIMSVTESGIATNSETQDHFKDYKFRIQIRTGNGNWKTVASALDNSSNKYTIRDLEMGTEYGIRVVAVDDVTWKNYTLVNGDGYSEELKQRTNTIGGLSVKKSYTTRNEIYKEKRPLKVKGLMLHSVGDNVQSAETWYNIYNRKGYDRAAVHAFIDGSDGKVWQTMPWGQRAGHAGRKANDSYIGVEMCESKYIDYNSGTNFTIASKYRSNAKSSATKTYWASVRLFAYLCDRYNLDPLKEGVIYSHNEWRIKTGSGHWDPEHYWKGLSTGFTMKQFRKDVKSVLDESITYY